MPPLPTKVDLITGEFRDKFTQLLRETPKLSTTMQCGAVAQEVITSFYLYVLRFIHVVKLEHTAAIPPNKKCKISSPEEVSIKCKKALVREALASVKDKLIENDFYSLYTGDQSAKGYDKARLVAQKDTTGRKTNPRKQHYGTIEDYKYDSSKLVSILIDAEDDMTKINWTRTYREVGLKSKSGSWPGNGGQVCLFPSWSV